MVNQTTWKRIERGTSYLSLAVVVVFVALNQSNWALGIAFGAWFLVQGLQERKKVEDERQQLIAGRAASLSLSFALVTGMLLVLATKGKRMEPENPLLAVLCVAGLSDLVFRRIQGGDEDVSEGRFWFAFAFLVFCIGVALWFTLRHSAA